MEEDLLKWEAVVLGSIQWDEIISGFLDFYPPFLFTMKTQAASENISPNYVVL